MKHFLFYISLVLIFMSCADSNEDLVVDYLDMSSNDYSVQLSYQGEIEMFQNNSYTLDITQPDSCGSSFLRRRVLPKHGDLQVEGNRIIYLPNRNFYGVDSIQYEICCSNKCNVFSMKFVVWRDNEERCEKLFSTQSCTFYYGYSIGEIATSTVIKVGLQPPLNCVQFVESITINKKPKFGLATIKMGQEVSYEGDLPKNTSDTILYTLKVRIGEKTQSKAQTFVIERFD